MRTPSTLLALAFVTVLSGCGSAAQDAAPADTGPGETAESELRGAGALSVELFQSAAGDVIFHHGQGTRPPTQAERASLRAQATSVATATCQAFAGAGARTQGVHEAVDFGWRPGLGLADSVHVLDMTFSCKATFASEARLLRHLVSKLEVGNAGGASDRLAQDELSTRVPKQLVAILDAGGAAHLPDDAAFTLARVIGEAAAKDVVLARRLGGEVAGTQTSRARLAVEALRVLAFVPNMDEAVSLTALSAAMDAFLRAPAELQQGLLEVFTSLHPVRFGESGFNRAGLRRYNETLESIAAGPLRFGTRDIAIVAARLLARTGESGLELYAALLEDATIPVDNRLAMANAVAFYPKQDLSTNVPISVQASALRVAKLGDAIAVEVIAEHLVVEAAGANASRAAEAQHALDLECPSGVMACKASTPAR